MRLDILKYVFFAILLVLVLMIVVGCTTYHWRYFEASERDPSVEDLSLWPILEAYQGSSRADPKRDTTFESRLCLGWNREYGKDSPYTRIDYMLIVDRAVIQFEGLQRPRAMKSSRQQRDRYTCSGYSTVFLSDSLLIPMQVDTVMASVFCSGGPLLPGLNHVSKFTMIRSERRSFGPLMD